MLFAMLSDRHYAKLLAMSCQVRGNQLAPNSILYFSRKLFDKDMDIVSDNLRAYRWICIPHDAIRTPQRSFIPESYWQQTYYVETLHDRKVWSRAEKFAKAILSEFMDRYDLKACMDGNIDYWQTHAFRVISKKIGLPFFVLSKENPSTPVVEEIYRQRYAGFEFEGTAIACPSKRLKDLFSELGVVKSKHIWNSGFPRLDPYRLLVVASQHCSNILVFNFMNRNYGTASNDDFFSVLSDVQTAIDDSSANEKSGIIVKMKSAGDLESFRSTAAGLRRSEILAKCSFESDRSVADCLSLSCVAIGANSQALLEALLVQVRLIIPMYALGSDASGNFFSRDDDLEELDIHLVDDAERLKFLTNQSLDSLDTKQYDEKVMAGRLELLNRFITYDKYESSSAKIGQMLSKYID